MKNKCYHDYSLWLTQNCSVERGGKDDSSSCDLPASEYKMLFLEQCPIRFLSLPWR